MNQQTLINKLFSFVEQDSYGNTHAILNREYYESNNIPPNTFSMTGYDSTNVLTEFTKKCDGYKQDFMTCVGLFKKEAYERNPDNPKAVFIKGVNESFVNGYNFLLKTIFSGKENDTMKLQGYTSEEDGKKTIYLIRNGANCPEIMEGQVYAGGAIVIVKHNNKYYFLVMKDFFHKKKECFTMPKGGCCYKDFAKHKIGRSVHPQLYLDTAEREVEEESTDGDNPNLKLKLTDLFVKVLFNVPEKFASKNSEGVRNYPDNFGICTTFIENDGKDLFLNRLFDENNLDKNGNYILKFSDNKETQFFVAVPLDDTILQNVQSEDDYYQLISKINPPIIDIGNDDNSDERTVLKFHLSTAYLFLAKHMGLSVNEFEINERHFIEEILNYPVMKSYIIKNQQIIS